MAHTPEARLKRAATQQINALAQHAWKPTDQPSWLTAEFYSKKLQPALLSVRGSLIARRLKVSRSYGNDIRRGKRISHPRHWEALAELAGLDSRPWGTKRLDVSIGCADQIREGRGPHPMHWKCVGGTCWSGRTQKTDLSVNPK
jgi:hypothetical protein